MHIVYKKWTMKADSNDYTTVITWREEKNFVITTVNIFPAIEKIREDKSTGGKLVNLHRER